MRTKRRINIEVRGVGFVNKGAELMLQAIKQKVFKYDPEINLAIEIPYGRGVKESNDLVKRVREEGILAKPAGRVHGINIPLLYNLLPMVIREKRGIILEKDIDVILDASGFAFGDQWGAAFAQRRLTANIERWHNQGKKIILLPQAFGPFNDTSVREEMSKIFRFANLIFARDTTSYESLLKLHKEDNKITKYPDFTNLIECVPPKDFNSAENQVAIIPNFKMGGVDGGIEKYKELLKNCVVIIQSMNFSPFFLIHEGERDEAIANDINLMLEEGVPVIAGKNAMEIKGIIGATHATITSRFHGLVSALSQGVPCLATSWSHKYKRLLDDYEYSDGLLTDLLIDFDELKSKLESVLIPTSNFHIKEKLLSKAIIQKQLSEDMWKKTFAELEK
ncbi:polysaccharide pyruvyl transferase family protein [Echinicola rosea]|uniref:Polysaccharide pyruvyl transferase domain-containing protein n=1 Tax=Echinicola rosea TaxID=1807691 RepID=A0ABQ1VDL9_9BACT|nr:polysaccharide pyruvyl transferase family protein [Echinicola rosea]GGF51616.1 hypothetical protein GCM10011339_45190 [Echinicola rosea]